MHLKVESIILRFHLYLFQLIGYFPLSLNTKKCNRSKVECLQRCWSLVLLLAFSGLTLTTLLNQKLFLYSGDDSFGYFNDIVKVILAQITIVTIYIESSVKREDLRTFWLHYMRLQSNSFPNGKWFSGTTTILKELRKHFRFLCIFYGIALLELVVDIIFISYLLNNDDRQLMFFWCMFWPYIQAVRLRNIQFILHIEVIRHELTRLKSEIGLLADYTRFSQSVTTFPGFEKYLRRKIVDKQLIYQYIYEMYVSFQAHFGCSIVCVLLMIYVRVVIDAYFAYYRSCLGLDGSENLLLIPACLEIPAFLLTSKNCMSVVKHITFELHSIISNVDNDNIAISVQIQNFSLQILHQKIRLDGLGITTLDGYMLTRAVGSITTYMIFFIQFMPKFQNL